MNRFEDRLVRNIDVNRFYEEAEREINAKRFHLDDFKDHYGEEAVEKDKNYVDENRERLGLTEFPEKLEAWKNATVFEASMDRCIEKAGWLGPDNTALKSSDFDDIKNGIDTIVESKEGKSSASYLGLAIDVTTNAEAGKKFDRIKDEIDNGKMPEVKYFRSEHMNIRGTLEKIPRVVVWADPKTIEEIAELSFSKNYGELSNHPAQIQILEEVLIQLKTFGEYAASIGEKDLAKIYEKAREKIESIYKNKKVSIPHDEKYDSVADAIYMNIHKFKIKEKYHISEEKKAAAREHAKNFKK
ncbi:MAG: hypothetical protein ABSE68_01655 [Minisyncoccia bacterium]